MRDLHINLPHMRCEGYEGDEWPERAIARPARSHPAPERGSYGQDLIKAVRVKGLVWQSGLNCARKSRPEIAMRGCTLIWD